MRTQLQHIERAEKYLNNELSAVERAEFEQELATDSELKAITENVRNLQAAVFRNQLRKKIESHSGGNNKWGNATIIGVLLITVSMLAWLFFTSPDGKNLSKTERSGQPESVSNTRNATRSYSAVPEESEANEKPILQQAALSKADTNAIISPKFQLGGLVLWAEPNIQSFRFESADGATIEGEDGMLIIVPTQAFVDQRGYAISGTVEFRLVEAFGIEEMLPYRLHTVSNGSTIESGGMFYLEAFIDGKPVDINPKRPLYIEIPTLDKKEGMMTFEGEIKDGKINWVNPEPLKKYLTKFPFDELDFLPYGFKNKVKANMPFLNYVQADKTLVDSLYYTLKNVEIDDKRTQPTWWGGGRRGYEKIEVACGIHPTTIEAIKTKEYSQTFVATKEFEERIRLLHKQEKGNDLLEIYLANLTKDLYVSDSLVALELAESAKEKFVRLAQQKLTNVKNAPLYQKRLTDYYVKKRRELQNAHDELTAQLAEKNAQELKAIYGSVSNTLSPNAVAPNWDVADAIPTPNAATTFVYATTWNNMGWGNIDRFYKILDNDPVQTPIAISNMPQNTSVSQWLGAINSYIDLRYTSKGYTAIFPKGKGSATTTHVFAIAESGEDFLWGMKRYNPYKDKNVEFEMATASLKDIRADLRGVSTRFGKIRERLEWKQEQAAQIVQREIELRESNEAWLLERQKRNANQENVLREQQEIETMVNELRKVAFPCSDKMFPDVRNARLKERAVPISETFFTIVEEMPIFPGGDAALMQFISQNVHYPKSLVASNISGTAYISYVVNAGGSVTDVRVARSSGNTMLDQEAIRVISELNGYMPGRQRGKPVAVQFTVPVRFQLN